MQREILDTLKDDPDKTANKKTIELHRPIHHHDSVNHNTRKNHIKSAELKKAYHEHYQKHFDRPLVSAENSRGETPNDNEIIQMILQYNETSFPEMTTSNHIKDHPSPITER